ncbi:hypothetical protein N9Z27_00490 [Alphaproteobacteria bacterium]|nr:hypothetical protein [Alphaproteobacteria bacterium]
MTNFFLSFDASAVYSTDLPRLEILVDGAVVSYDYISAETGTSTTSYSFQFSFDGASLSSLSFRFADSSIENNRSVTIENVRVNTHAVESTELNLGAGAQFNGSNNPVISNNETVSIDVPSIDHFWGLSEPDLADVGDATFTGTESGEYIKTKGQDDIIDAGGGNDEVVASAGDDAIFGGAGNDTIIGGYGNDLLVGGDDDDSLFGRNDNDILFGSAGEDNLYGDLGDDYLNGGADNDRLEGNDGEDVLFGEDGTDRLYGMDGDDKMHGGAGDDYMYGDLVTGSESYTGNDLMFGGAGNDIMHGHGGIDEMHGGDDNDKMYGGDDNDTMYGDAGNDVLEGGDGDDILNGGAGNNILRGGNGQDMASFEDETTAVSVNLQTGNVSRIGGNDKLVSIESARGGAGDDVLAGTNTDNVLEGGAGNDQLYGHDGDDTINGGDGIDYILGGDGNDTIDAGAGIDRIDGGAGDDIINGGADKDRLIGGNGNDQLFGDDGNDSLVGGAGDDILNGGAGNDVLSYDSRDVFIGGTGIDILRTEAGFSGNVAMTNMSRYDSLEYVNLMNKGGVALANRLNIRMNTFQNATSDDILYVIGDAGLDTVNLSNLNYFQDFVEITTINSISYEHFSRNGNSLYIQDGLRIKGPDEDVDIAGDSGDNILTGTLADEVIAGLAGNDTLVSGGGADTLLGGDGDDILIYDPAAVSYVGGNGHDTIMMGENDGIDLDINSLSASIFDNINHIDLNNYNGTSAANDITIRYGNVSKFNAELILYISGEVGVDTVDLTNLNASHHVDTFIQDGIIWEQFDRGGRTIYVEQGLDVVGGSPIISATITDGTSGNNVMNGVAGDDNLNGLAGNDTLRGFGGNNNLFGGDGDDVLLYDAGSNFFGGDGNDTLGFATGDTSNFDTRDGNQTKGVNVVDLNNGAGNANRFTVHMRDVLTFSEDDTLFIVGEVGVDTVNLRGNNGASFVETIDIGGIVYDHFNRFEADVYIQQGLEI